MPLPADGSFFPPRELAPGFARMREHGAWYTGDVDELRAIYGGAQSVSHMHAGQPMRGGITGFLSRMWWGRPLASGEERTALHIPMASNLATLSSDLLNAEAPSFGVAGDPDKATKTATEQRLDLIMNSPQSAMTQNEAGELEAALGGTYWVADWDLGPYDHVFYRSVDADAAVPTFRGGHLVEVSFWTRIDDGKKTYRHIEHHQQGAIIHALYVTDDTDRIGTRVSLTARPETAHLAELPGAVYDGLLTIIPTYIDRLTAVYEPNIRKPRKLRRKGQFSAWGRSDFEGVEPLLNAFDETWSSWMRDLKVGRARIFVPSSFVQNRGPGRGGFFDSEREVYALVDALPTTKDGQQITAQQFEIRVDQHERTAFSLKKEILQATGYSLSSYGEHTDQTAVTATEVQDRRSDTERTRDKKIRYATLARTRIASICLELDGIIFRGKGGSPGVDVVAEFPAVSQIDPEKEVRIVGLLDAASAISTETKVRRANPEWTDIQVGEEVARIQEEKGHPVPDPQFPPFTPAGAV